MPPTTALLASVLAGGQQGAHVKTLHALISEWCVPKAGHAVASVNACHSSPGLLPKALYLLQLHHARKIVYHGHGFVCI